jgi:hypothetical protein
VVDALKQGGVEKIGIKTSNNNPYDFSSVIINTYSFFKQSKSGTAIFPESSFILGFYGFDFAGIKNTRSFSLGLQDVKSDIFPRFLYDMADRYQNSLSIKDMEKVFLVYVKEDKRKEIISELGIPAELVSSNYPLYILWDQSNEATLPRNLEHAGKTMQLSKIQQSTAQGQKVGSKTAASTTITDFSKTYIAPEIDPSLLPAIIDFLRMKDPKNQSIDYSTKKITLEKKNNIIVVKNPDVTPAKEVRYTLQMVPVSLVFIQPAGEGRSDEPDPELKVIQPSLVKKMEFYWNRQRLYTDTLGRLIVPIIANLESEISIRSESSEFSITNSRYRKNEVDGSSEFEVNVSIPKRKLTVQLVDSKSRQPIHGATIYVDFQKGQIYNGKINSGDTLKNIIYNYPGLKYRLSFSHPEYRETSVRTTDTPVAITAEMEPKPSVSLFFIDKSFEVQNLPEIIRMEVKKSFKPQDSFVVFVSNGNNPIIISDLTELNSNTLNKIYDMQASPDQPEAEKSLIISSLNLDSQAEDELFKLYFYYNALRYIDDEGKLVDLVHSELTSAVQKKETSIKVIYTGNLSSERKNRNYQYIKYQ